MYRSDLVRLAYRMLGSAADAEDLVQELFARLSDFDWSGVANVKSYLAKAAVRRCIDALRARASQRERYVGPWLPEPMLEAPWEQPEEASVREEQVRYAALVLLETLSPPERAVYVLKELLGYRYPEIADMLELTESNCRQLLSRAKRKLPRSIEGAPSDARPDSRKAAELFLQAVRTDRYDELVRRLANDVKLISDGGGKRKAALRPIIGIDRVAAFVRGVRAKGAFDGEFRIARWNGEPGLLLTRGGRPALAVLFETDEAGDIASIYYIVNPEKLPLSV